MKRRIGTNRKAAKNVLRNSGKRRRVAERHDRTTSDSLADMTQRVSSIDQRVERNRASRDSSLTAGATLATVYLNSFRASALCISLPSFQAPGLK